MKQATILIALLAIVCYTLANPVANSPQKTEGDSSMIKIATMQEMLFQIIHVIGVNENFELKEADVLNIEATISHKKRYILYNPVFITSLHNATRNKWSVMALLAHELGHHLNGHTIRKGGSSPALELEADEFAGFALYKLGATLGESQTVMHFIAKTEESKTHPSRTSRLQAIEKGWKRAADAAAESGTTANR